MIEIEPKAEYLNLTREEVLTALDDTDATNPIAIEVARLIEGYAGNFSEYVANSVGDVPSEILRIKPRSAIEAVAMQLTTKTIKETIGIS
tara:strand:- start:228 stop:497 length:270 start_codon:yes stop_codon:yes gene_type:complete